MKPPWMDDPPVQALLAALTRGGIAARFVGGCVRDTVLGRPVGEIDIAVDKPPETVMRALEAADLKVVPTGLKHGTVTAIVKGKPFELTTLRRDVETDGRRAVVAFTDDWRIDAERRDFTFNAMYAEPDGTIWDPFDGRADLLAGRVRFIGDPDQRIAEDRLRVLRFFRFHAWFGKPPLDSAGFDACRRNAGALSSLSAERVAKELLRLLAAPAPTDALEAMAEAGALDHWLPEYAGAARLKALIAREREDCARSAAPAGRNRLAARDGGRQAAETLDPAIAAPAVDAGTRGSRRSFKSARRALSTRHQPLHRPRAARGSGRLARRPRACADMDPAGIADRRRRCAGARPQTRAPGGRAARGRRALVDRRRFFRRPRRLPGRAEAPCPHGMIRPGLTFALWLAIVVFVVLNDMVGDTWIGLTLSVRAVEWYKALVPLPYVAMLALIHARRTAGPRWFEAALLAALLWPSSTVIVDFLYARFFYADDPAAFLDRFAFWWGAPYPLLVLGLFAFPIVAGAALSRHPDRRRA